MSIDSYRTGFLFTAALAVALTLVSVPSALMAITCGLLLGCMLLLAGFPDRASGRVLGGMALATAGIAGASLTTARGVSEPSGHLFAAASAIALAAGGLVWSWQRRLPVRHGAQVNLAGLFGWRMIRGPTRIRRPGGLLSRVISIIPLREMKSELVVGEIDTHGDAARASELRLVSDGPGLGPLGPSKIHLIELSVTYRIDGPRWFLLNEIPRIESQKHELAPEFGGLQRAQEQAAFWERLLDRFVRQEADESLRHVVHHHSWSASEVSDQRADVASAMIERLSPLSARYGLIITGVELTRVAVDSPQALRAARDTTLRGEALLGLQGGQIERLRQQLRGYFSPAEIEEILRTHAVELGYYIQQPAQLSYFLDSLATRRRGPTRFRDAA